MQNTASLWVDQFGREKRKLRISVTDRCNFKCSYCMPEHPEWINKKNLVGFEALYQFCELMVQSGIESIRITGGEPLMRKGVMHFIKQLQQLKPLGLKRISMTSNGHYLKKYALALKQAGLDDLNISLDTLDAGQFQQLTKNDLAPVLSGIEQARQVGLAVKINTVLIRGQNEDQILPLVAWAKAKNMSLRFIEFMPLDGDAHWQKQDVVTEQDILTVLATQYQLHLQTQGSEPARRYLLDEQYEIGIISTISHAFCGSCDRIRMTAQGELYNCLFATQGLALKPQLDVLLTSFNLEFKQQLQQKIQQYIWHKESGFEAIYAKKQPRKISMHMLGG
ncbi:GTP 3',8-cyclase MoaA [Acinetobacter sp. ANC 3781]|nr:GTP 3',8-cyclase MoaA [Acinetobacter sp. ANC 3781]